MMKNNYIFKTLIATLLFSTQFFAQVNVTLKVDMSGQTIDAEGVHVVGSINSWNTLATPLTQEGETNIYSATIQLNTGWHEYKFLNGNAWGKEESAGYPCAPSNGNRFLYINDSGTDVVLESVPFNGCNAEGTGFSLTLNVDMASETVSENGVKIAGWFNGWNGDNFITPDIDGSIYSATLRLPSPSDYPIVFEYKYVNGSEWETPSANCPTVIETNRVHALSSSGQSVDNVFNACNSTLSTRDSFLTDIKIFQDKNQELIIRSFNNHENLNIQMFDMLGKKVLSKNLLRLTDNDSSINLKSIDSGLFILKITDNGNRVYSKKILIK